MKRRKDENMNVLCIIAEYNPFHYGHLYHLNEAKKIVKPDFTMCILAGHFLQRGEPSIVDKWSKTKMALEAGIDLVLELPVAFSCRSALHYAHGAITSLEKTGVATHLAFGSETNNLLQLQEIAQIINNEDELFKSLLNVFLDQGLSYPKAIMLTLEKTLTLKPGALKELDKPNSILALSYLQVLDNLKSNITPIQILRKGDYHSSNYNAEFNSTCDTDFKSASEIRQLIKNNESIWKNHVPAFSRKILESDFQKGRGPVFLNNFEQNIISTIRRSNPLELKNIIEINEGLENRIYQSAQKYFNIESLLMHLKTKRYTYTKLQRSLIHIYLRYEKQLSFTDPKYLRILGLNNKGQNLLKEMKTRSALPLINKFAPGFKKLDDTGRKMLDLEARATDLYSLAFPNPNIRHGKQDYYTSPLKY